MTTTVKKMKPIWYFVGLILLTLGCLILLAGIYYLIYPSQIKTVLPNLYPNIWWGAIMIVVGAVFVLRTRKLTVE